MNIIPPREDLACDEPETNDPIEWYHQIKNKMTERYLQDRAKVFQGLLEDCGASMQGCVDGLKNMETVTNILDPQTAETFAKAEMLFSMASLCFTEAAEILSQVKGDQTLFNKIVDNLIAQEYPERFAQYQNQHKWHEINNDRIARTNARTNDNGEQDKSTEQTHSR